MIETKIQVVRTDTGWFLILVNGAIAERTRREDVAFSEMLRLERLAKIVSIAGQIRYEKVVKVETFEAR